MPYTNANTVVETANTATCPKPTNRPGLSGPKLCSKAHRKRGIAPIAPQSNVYWEQHQEAISSTAMIVLVKLDCCATGMSHLVKDLLCIYIYYVGNLCHEWYLTWISKQARLTKGFSTVRLKRQPLTFSTMHFYTTFNWSGHRCPSPYLADWNDSRQPNSCARFTCGIWCAFTY